VALALEVPVACVITKADVAPPEAVDQVLQDVRYCFHHFIPVAKTHSGR